mmetsp:Transcript_20862/g.45494  ORF Transcript_20862/g.45494 Transcript_20862/m.45494 type:complete len:534 (-) Transcript_20862:158-1759(-)
MDVGGDRKRKSDTRAGASDIQNGGVSSVRTNRLRSQILSRLSDPSVVRPVEASQCDTVGDGRNQATATALIRISRSEAASLSSIPWKRFGGPLDTTSSRNCCESNSHLNPATDNNHSNRNDARHASTSRRGRHNLDAPIYSYVDLRLSQNMSWANHQLRSGVVHAKRAQTMQEDSPSIDSAMREYKKAEKCYRDGLDLVPSHPELLVAYGALCANLNRDEEAVEILTKAVKYTCTEESKVGCEMGAAETKGHSSNREKNEESAKEAQLSTGKNARQYLAEVTRRLATNSKQVSSTSGLARINRFTSPSTAPTVMRKGGEARAEQARRDALAERAFLSGSGAVVKNGSNSAGQSRSSKYELIDEPLSKDSADHGAKLESDGQEDQRIERRRRKKHARKHKKKKRKRRQYRSDSTSRSHGGICDNARESSRRTGGKQKRYKEREKKGHKRRRRNDDCCAESSLSSSSMTSSSSSGSGRRYESDSNASSTSSHNNHKRRTQKESRDRSKKSRRRAKNRQSRHAGEDDHSRKSRKIS